MDIEARVSSTSMKALAEKINLYSSKTGVSAIVSSDKKRLVMESKDGSDIKHPKASWGVICQSYAPVNAANRTVPNRTVSFLKIAKNPGFHFFQ